VLPNIAPVAVDDTATTFSGTPVTVSVLDNDTDGDGDTLTIAATAGGPTNGTATITGSGIEYTPNPGFAGTDSFTYSISDGNGGTASATVTITVVKRTATVTAGSGSKVYGAAEPTLTAASTGFLGGDGIVVSQEARDAGEAVGTYATHATATGDQLVNYDVTYTDGTLEITPATPTPVATGGTFTYDGTTHDGACAVTGVNGESLAGTISYSSGGAPVNAGSYTVTCSFAGDANYTAASAEATITINPAVATPVATGGTFTYDGTAHDGACAVTGVNGESLGGTISYSSSGAPVNAGSYTVTCSFA
jgi:hypothetical protein